MRIVVAGIGVVTPLGDDYWECVSKGMVKGYSVRGYENSRNRLLDITNNAMKKASLDAGLSSEELEATGVTISSSKGNISQVVQDLASGIKCEGPKLNVVSACATGLNSIIMGAGLIKTGRAKVVLAGGADSCKTDFITSAFSKIGVLARDNVCRPYSRNRSGFVLSEGACVVVLEEYEHAKKRNAKIYGEVSGWSSLSDAYHITSLDPLGTTIACAIEQCVDKAGVLLGEIDYINTHGTGTIGNDLVETTAIKKVFGKEAFKIPTSSTKAVTGHMLGASGAFEFVVGLLAMRESFIPPTANYDEPDPLCDLDYTPNIGRKKELSNFITLSYGFGGHIAVVSGRKI